MNISHQQQQEWASLKYLVMSKSQAHYNQIRELFRDNQWDEEKEKDYRLALEESLAFIPTLGSLKNAYQHVWGYFKRVASSTERVEYQKLLAELKVNQDDLGIFLKNLAQKYQVEYLLKSKLLF